jgi:hypothetical protein
VANFDVFLLRGDSLSPPCLSLSLRAPGDTRFRAFRRSWFAIEEYNLLSATQEEIKENFVRSRLRDQAGRVPSCDIVSLVVNLRLSRPQLQLPDFADQVAPAPTGVGFVMSTFESCLLIQMSGSVQLALGPEHHLLIPGL